MKLGSLFDGSGGFPLAGVLCGIEPIWAAEIEPYPIAVTKSRFPKMKHLGSVTDINGADIEPVDIITFGSPCQDMSVAGKRAGIKHTDNGDEETTRSGLFIEAIRIIKEMRKATNGIYPRFAIWENVPGAFSSNKGEDFRCVLEEFVQINEPNAVMPEVPKNGWSYFDCYYGDGWSIAYRTFDAQFWGVPQRRKRIYLVADFRGGGAKEILFERDGLQRNFKTSRKEGESSSSNVYGCINGDNSEVGVCTYDARGNGNGNICNTVTGDHNNRITDYTNIVAMATQQGGAELRTDNKSPTLTAAAGMSGNNQPIVSYGVTTKGNGDAFLSPEKHTTLSAGGGQAGQGYPAVCTANAYSFFPQMKAENMCFAEEMSGCLVNGTNPGFQNGVVISIDRETINCGRNFTRNLGITEEGVNPTLKATGADSVCYEADSQNYIVRRLTPTECARLQGFPDAHGHLEKITNMTDEEYEFWLEVRKTHAKINNKAVKDYTKQQMVAWYNKLWSDSSEYKMWGNGIALPNALYCMEGIVEAYNKEIKEQHNESN